MLGADTPYWLLARRARRPRHRDRRDDDAGDGRRLRDARPRRRCRARRARSTSLQRVGGSIGTALLAVVLQHQITTQLAGVGGGAAGGGGAAARCPRRARADRRAARDARSRNTFWWAVGMSAVALVPAAILARSQRRERRAQALAEAAEPGRLNRGRPPERASRAVSGFVRSQPRLLLAVAALLALAASCSPAAARHRPSRALGRRHGRPQPATSPAGPRRPGRRLGADRRHHPRQASSPFWAIVRNGVEAAARQMDVLVNYRAPDVYSLDRMKALVDQAIASKPDGLVVSLPEPGIGAGDPPRRAAPASPSSRSTRAATSFRTPRRARARRPARAPRRARGRPPAGRRRGAPRAVRQPAGRQPRARRPLRAGSPRRCARRAAARPSSASTTRARRRPSASPRRSRATHRRRADPELDDGAMEALAGRAARPAPPARASRRSTSAPTSCAPSTRGRLLFAVDQQAYLQGYLPVALLTQRARYGLFPDEGGVISTGPALRHARQRRAGDRAQPPLDPLSDRPARSAARQRVVLGVRDLPAGLREPVREVVHRRHLDDVPRRPRRTARGRAARRGRPPRTRPGCA